MKITVDLELSKECIIQISGDYYPQKEGTRDYDGDNSELDITGISFLKGGLLEYTDFCDGYMSIQVKKATLGYVNVISIDCIWEHLNHLALNKYKESL